MQFASVYALVRLLLEILVIRFQSDEERDRELLALAARSPFCAAM